MAASFVVVLTCVVALVVAAPVQIEAPQSLSYYQQFLDRTAAVRAQDPAFECEWRKAAYLYAQKIQPLRSASHFQEVFDALQLQDCGQTFSSEGFLQSRVPTFDTPADATSIFVDYIKGDDSNQGTIDSPVKTVAQGVVLARKVAQPVVQLRGGVHQLASTIALGPQDSGLIIQNYNGEEAIVSGGIQLKTNWQPYNVSTNKTWLVEPNMNAVYGATPGGSVKVYGKTDSAVACEAACVQTADCHVWTWHDPQATGYENQCWLRLDNKWDLVGEGNHVSGCLTSAVPNCMGSNVYVTSLVGQGIADITGLQVGGAGVARGIRAKYPNGNPETTLFPQGWISSPTNWIAPRQYPTPHYVEDATPVRNQSTMFNNFMVGVGGTCSIYNPPSSYWCCEHPAGGGAFQFRVPSGLHYTQDLLPHTPYAHGVGANVHAWRPAHWANWMFDVDSYDPAAQTISWHIGGFQGARGENSGGEWFIENVLEELDAPMEFFYDKTTQNLYYFHNATGAPPADLVFIATNLKTLFQIEGDNTTKAKGITLRGLTLTAAAYTYMDDHSVPSGGDWALQRMGAIFIQNTEGTTIDSNLITRVDGNGLMLSGYNRNTLIQNNEFVWIGDSAMASWGYTAAQSPSEGLPFGDGINGTQGWQPRNTTVVGNFVHELGHYEKQSSCWFQAKTAQTTLSRNICFNGPRAGININDGFGGGNELVNNLMFNTCRESGDHGPFNSWDRQPFLTDVANPNQPSLVPLYNELHHNFLVANYGANGGCVDNDDGSSWYNLHDNFFVYGGHKSDFGGHNKRSWNNVMAYPQVYGERCLALFGMPLPGYEEGYWNNTCILADKGATYADFEGCDLHNKNTWTIISHDNRVYVPGASAVVQCGGTISLQQWQQASGQDAGTTLNDAVDGAQIITWARQVLGF